MITGGKGADSLFGDEGDDVFWAVDDAPDTIDGGAGNDSAYVVAADDTTNNVEQVIDLG